ncbi:oxalate decarboxylase [Gloeophyllum trabeum ATCC 11539]|uniref:Oxalate decarboxylase n=1 Tax=Gloeophyllum trabeum (strain ATCC 11539 / FP-39264 / Madison 617) TaxID=670483 RepID=S7Q3N8_GLOTA|nr:oxalate decarboxylase [Gloeophyllum trabeum ATCC 11539]EPQ54172.1 oxalate decarboxylase [Gloeophyllum trabeum ATCC 11539]
MVCLPAAYLVLACVASALAAPASPSVSSAEPEATLPYASDDPNAPLWNEDTTSTPEAIRGSLGATVIGPQNVPIDQQNPDILAPPSTDAGTIGQAKWPMGLSHNRLQTGGWARQQNEAVLPMATEMAGVNMRLDVGAIRELHWHKTDEWAYILKGSVQVSAVNPDGQNYLATVSAGDLWYFPAGIPHSLQATADDPDGCEFLLVFDDGAFSEDATFLLTDWLAHVPKEVIAKNFQTDISAFDHIPAEELYIFPSAPPPDDAQAPSSPYGTVPQPYTFKMSQVNATQLAGGTVKVVDSTTFPVSVNTAVAEVTVEPGAMRELHWHPTQDEWDYFIGGTARITLFGSTGNARTFDYQGGDVGYIPASYGHYVENTGNTTLHFLEIFKTDRYQDISLSQWLALTPPALVKAHLNISDELIASLSKTKPIVVGPR